MFCKAFPTQKSPRDRLTERIRTVYRHSVHSGKHDLIIRRIGNAYITLRCAPFTSLAKRQRETREE